MRRWLAILFFAGAFPLLAQTVATPYRVLHPIMKDPTHRYAPTSLDQDPSEALPPPAARSAPPAARSAPGVATGAARPVEVVAKIEAGLAVSKITLMGTIDGLKGRFYVTNLGPSTVTPRAQLAVCDPKGFQLGSTSKTGAALAPNEEEKIEVLATNLNAVDLKLMKLTGSQNK